MYLMSDYQTRLSVSIIGNGGYRTYRTYNPHSKKSASKTTIIDFVLFHFVAENSFCRVEQSSGARSIASRGLQRVLNQILLEGADGLIQTHPGHGAGSFSGLQRRRQMVAMNDVAFADQRRALDHVLEFAHVTRPVITHQHVYGRRGDSLDPLAVLAAVFFEEMVGQQQDVGLALAERRQVDRKNI